MKPCIWMILRASLLEDMEAVVYGTDSGGQKSLQGQDVALTIWKTGVCLVLKAPAFWCLEILEFFLGFLRKMWPGFIWNVLEN